MNFAVKLSDNLELREMQSRLLQKIAFENRWTWHGGSILISNLDKPYIRFWFDKTMTASYDGYNVYCSELLPIDQALEYLMNSDKSKTELKSKVDFAKFKWEEMIDRLCLKYDGFYILEFFKDGSEIRRSGCIKCNFDLPLEKRKIKID